MRFEWKRLPAGCLDHERIWGIAAAGFGIIAAIAPLDALRFSCPLKQLTGWPCVTCGMTRAVLAWRRLDLAAAFGANPLVAALAVFAVFYAVYACTVALLNTRRLRISLTRRWEPNAIRVLAVAALLANWIYLITAGR
ncbi:MAG: DUF2752 domain-containing protein [Candidatus Sumerlaeia bacterium]|nr:DUF2752 domain-containing protein [Candidatus Sumerlaeia bacterium]